MNSVNLETRMPKSPRESANLLSKLYFWWLVKLFWLGQKRDLELEDLYRVLPEDRSQTLGDNLASAWKNEIQKSEEKYKKLLARAKVSNPEKVVEKPTPSFLRALISVFGWQYTFMGIFAFTDECVLKIAQPIGLGLLIRYFAGEFQHHEGYIFAAFVLVCSMVYTTQHHPYFFGVQHIGMQMRVASSSLIYRKALRLSQASLGKTAVGQLVNFLSNDVNRFDLATGFFHYLYIGPIQLGIVIYILWGYFGPSAFAGVALLILFVPFQSQMGRLFGKLRLEVAGRTDRRIRLMNEVVSAMRVVKMYAWELPFSHLISGAREDEIKVIRKTSNLRAVNLSLFYISSKLIIFCTLVAYVLTGNYLNSEKVFVTLSLYNNVRLIMTLFFPGAISQLAEVLVSIKRIQTFLLLEDRLEPEGENQYPDGAPTESKGEVGVKVQNLSCKWDQKSEESTLENVTLEVKRGQLVAVIGPVGCGKGSLLQAVLRELPAFSGDVNVFGRLAYTSQEPWVFGGSVKQNILFGREYDSKWYDEVIESCALKRDLTLLPFGDNTLVGDRGTSLSGGQKARVNLARAVYAKADIYLLDDPLSAVDAEVGRHLFDNCIMGTLKNKARILVTHQLQFLKGADQIILLNNGKVQFQGTYTDLLKTGINFAQMLQSTDDGTPQHQPKLRPSASEISILGHSSKREFKRSSSMSLLEMSFFDISVHQEFEGDPEDPRCKSYTQSHDRNRTNKKSELLYPAYSKKYGTFTAMKIREQPVTPDEIKSSGDVGLKMYWNYIHAGSNWFTLLLLILSNLVTQVLFTGSDYWLQFWTKSEEARTPNRTIFEDPIYQIDENPTELLDPERATYLYFYCGIIGALFVISLLRTAGFFTICMRSSINLHRKLFAGVLRAPMRFYELNPVGRVLNRFAKDIGIIDESLPSTIFDTVEIALQVIGVLIIICIVNPILVIPSLILMTLFYNIRKFYLHTARSIKRLEGIARSPVFSHLSTSLYGLTTIRAFRAEKEFEEQFDAHQDIHSSSWYLFLATARWLGICVDWFSVVYIGVVTYSFMFFESQGGAAVGLAVSSAMALTGALQWGVRQSAETENHLVSVERVLEYSNLDPEPPLESTPARKPPKDWPSKGEIKMKNIFLRYDEEAPVLRQINFVIKPKEKVGIVGRTGAGKSSLITALFRIAEPSSGTIEIDGINVLNIGLHDLRSKISIIPQDPVLFTGTLRRNLDPFGEYNDADMWKVLEEVHLLAPIKELQTGLDTEISEGGSNFSVGQRQLVCLGRAILRRNKILVLDEATANIDHETDALIQKTIRVKFEDCTVLTVAHRLHTVMDSDRILVLDAGRIKEFDEPFTLLQDTNSSLYQLVEQTGKDAATTLLHIATNAFEKRNNPSITSVQEEDGSEDTFSTMSESPHVPLLSHDLQHSSV